MYTIIFSEQFEKSFSKIKEDPVKRQLWNKILELETRAPIGKKLKGNPFWSIHVGKYRVIYLIEGMEITIADILQRKHDYKEL